MTISFSRRLTGALLAAATLATPLAVGAQTYPAPAYPEPAYPTPTPPAYPAPAPGYAPPPDTGYDQAYQAYNQAPPPGYDPSRPPPPPPGYQADANYAATVQADQRYEAYAEDWAQRYCVRAQNNTGAGAVIGGLFGALLGVGIAGRHDSGAGAVIGGLAGAGAGAAIGSANSNATSPGCPPGYVVRGGAPAFYYEGYGDPYLYAAPGWYQPWIFVGGRWDYRPYPYHTFYYTRFGYGRPYGYGRGWGGPGWRGGYYRGRPGWGWRR